MLKFVVLKGFASKDAGHATLTYDTTMAEDVEKATVEFDRLVAEGRSALTEQGVKVEKAADLPAEGTVHFILPMAGG